MRQITTGGRTATVTLSHTGEAIPGASVKVTVAVDDDESPGITLSPTALNVNEQNTATYTVVLATQPKGGGVTVAITGAGAGITVNISSLSFTELEREHGQPDRAGERQPEAALGLLVRPHGFRVGQLPAVVHQR